MRKLFCITFCVLIFLKTIFSQNTTDESWIFTSILQRAYPEKTIIPLFDKSISLWTVNITAHNKTTQLYWKEGRLLPYAQLEHFQNYDKLFTYIYPEAVRDPSTLTEQEVETIRNMVNNREDGNARKKSQDFLLNAIYDGTTQQSTAKHIVSYLLFDKRINVHQDIVPALNRAQTRIQNEAKTNKEVQAFIDSLGNLGAFNWREIQDIESRSTHSWGISIDILPKRMNTHEFYWLWTKSINEKNWMKTPLKQRWIPPAKVISIFEEEGFVWGGKWTIWDNMHFEYRPDILLYSHR